MFGLHTIIIKRRRKEKCARGKKWSELEDFIVFIVFSMLPGYFVISPNIAVFINIQVIDQGVSTFNDLLIFGLKVGNQVFSIKGGGFFIPVIFNCRLNDLFPLVDISHPLSYSHSSAHCFPVKR